MTQQPGSSSVKSIKNGKFALTREELYQNKPFSGAVFVTGPGGQEDFLTYVDSERNYRLRDFLDENDIDAGTFRLKTHDPDGEEVTIDFSVGKNPTQNSPFAGMEGGQALPADRDSTIELLEERIQKIKQELDDSERLRRQLKTELRDERHELDNLRRQLNSEEIQAKLDYQEKLREIEKQYEAQIDDLKDKIRDLESDLKFKDLEYRQKDKDIGGRILDMIQEGGIDRIMEWLISLSAKNANMNPQQLSENFQQHFNQQSGMGSPQSQKPAENPQQTQQVDMAQVKQQIGEKLIQYALSAMINSDTDLSEYARQVKQQISLLKQQGITLDAEMWVQMAKVLAEQAIEKQITADRVAKIVQPVVEGVSGKVRMFRMVSPEKATRELFNQFNIDATDRVRQLVTEVIAGLQQSL